MGLEQKGHLNILIFHYLSSVAAAMVQSKILHLLQLASYVLKKQCNVFLCIAQTET